MVRYADDAVLGFENRDEAESLRRELQEQLRSVGLELHPEKTRMIEFGRFAASNRKRRREGKPETFDFLGFTHICGRTRTAGRFTVKRKTIGKRMRAKLQEIRQLRQRMHEPVPETGKWLRSVVLRLLQLSRYSRQRETASGMPRCGYTVLAAYVAPSKPDQQHRLGAHEPTGAPVDTRHPHYASVSECTL